MAGENLFILLITTAIVCFIFGMGRPPIPAYVLLAILIAPALDQLEMNIMAAYLFIVPFLFVLSPGLILKGSFGEILISFAGLSLLIPIHKTFLYPWPYHKLSWSWSGVMVNPL